MAFNFPGVTPQDPRAGYPGVGLLDGFKPTYSAAVFAHAPAANATDIFTILGSATKTVRVTRLWIAGRATAATWYNLSVVKYSTPFSGGTSAAPTIIPHDSNNPTATAVVNTWSGGLPTVGTEIGAICDDDIPLNILVLTVTQPFVPVPGLLYDFGNRPEQAIVLRGTNQYLAVNADATTIASGGVLDIKVTWTEE